MDKLNRLEKLIGMANIEKLKKQCVLVVGLGGVGGYCVEALARSGIGTLIIVDYDTIEETNLNRQLIATIKNIGKSKCEEWENRIKLISDTKVIPLNLYLKDLDVLNKYQITFIVDACDTITTKQDLILYAKNKNIPFISCMGTARKLNPTKLAITDLKNTSYDPLARHLRMWQKKQKIIGKIPVVSSTEPPIKTEGLGSNVFVPATAGLLLASYVVEKVCEC